VANLTIVAPFDIGVTVISPVGRRVPASPAGIRKDAPYSTLRFLSLPIGRPETEVLSVDDDTLRAMGTVPGFQLHSARIDRFATGTAILVMSGTVAATDASHVFSIDNRLVAMVHTKGVELVRRYLAGLARDGLPTRQVRLLSRSVTPRYAWTYSILRAAVEDEGIAQGFVRLSGRAFAESRLVSVYGDDLRSQLAVEAHVGARHAVLLEETEHSVDSGALMQLSALDFEHCLIYYLALWQSFITLNETLADVLPGLLTPATGSAPRVSARTVAEVAELRAYLLVLRQAVSPFAFGVSEAVQALMQTADQIWRTKPLLDSYDEKVEVVSTQYERAADELRQREAMRLAVTALVFTVLTIVSVIADFVGTVDFNHDLWPDRLVRTGVLIGPALVAGLLTWLAWSRR